MKPESKGYSSPGTLYASRAAHEEHKALHKAWYDMGQAMSGFKVPEGVTLDDIANARKLLKLV